MWLAVLMAVGMISLVCGSVRLCQEFSEVPVVLPCAFLACLTGLCLLVRQMTDALALRRRARMEAWWECEAWWRETMGRSSETKETN